MRFIPILCQLAFFAAPVISLAQTAADGPVLLIGTDAVGVSRNRPAEWPSTAGAWNAKGARYNPATRQLVFESYRADIGGGSIGLERGAIRTPGVTSYYYQAGPRTGTVAASGTTVLYVADKDGSRPHCVGCADVVDSRDGVQIFQVLPSPSGIPNAVVRKTGFAVYANQNKDLAAWYPDGKWIFAGVEMPRHALKHDLGNSEVGMFNDLWAISADGKIWVQPTDFAHTWQFFDTSTYLPFQSPDARNCSTGAQYAKGGARSSMRPSGPAQAPYESYACSARHAPPPAFGTMRPTVGNSGTGALVPIAWAERVGLDPKYAWAGPLQLAMGGIAFVNGLPTVVNYQRNLTPTPEHPDGKDLWSNPNGNTQIGCGYEPWAFSRDNSRLGVATDAFLSNSSPSVRRGENPGSEAFTDVGSWKWAGNQSFQNMTAYGRLYPYEPNGAPGEARYYGHWEEPNVFSLSASVPEYMAFGSSANLSPPWNPMDHKATIGLDVWVRRTDGSKSAVRLTHFNGGRGDRWLAYPTAADPSNNSLFVTVAPGGRPGANPPGAIYTLSVPKL